MTNKKYINEDIIFSLKIIATTRNCNECKIRNCKWGTCNCEQITANAALDLITCLQAENESLQAENKRLKNAYKQCAWERDIFAEDIKQEIKKDCSYLMLDIKNIKAEAYKECIEKVKEKASKTEYVCGGVLVKTDYTITEKELDNIIKETETEKEI